MIDEKTLVSIIIPAHNAANTIADTLRSALAQSWTRIETIVVDDGSSDETVSIVADVSKGVTRIVTQEQKGAAAARNAGLAAASGSYIQFLDADDVLSPAKIELQLSALRFATPRSVASCTWTHFEGDPAHSFHSPEPVWTVKDPVEWLVKSLSGGGMMQPGAWLTPRVLIDEAGQWNESLSLHDDGEFFHRVLLRADRNVFVEDAIVYYRTVPGSLSRVRNRAAILSALTVCKTRHELLLNVRGDDDARKAVATQYARFAYEFINTAPDLADEAIKLIHSLGVPPANTIGGTAFRLLSATAGFERALSVRRRFA